MLTEGMKILLHAANILAAIRHEDDLLVFLHSLWLQQFPQSPPGLFVVYLQEIRLICAVTLALVNRVFGRTDVAVHNIQSEFNARRHTQFVEDVK